MKQNMMTGIAILTGNILIAFALSTLVLEHDLVAGGVTGFGLVIQGLTGIKVANVVMIANVGLFLMGLLFIGKKFALTTLLSTFLFPMLLDLFEGMSFLHGYCEDVLLACVLAGCMIGIGIGLIIQAGASTGGTDILALLIQKKTGIAVAISLNVIDFILIALQIPGAEMMNVLYGFVVIFLTSFMLNKTLGFGKNLIQVMVISDAYEPIRDAILLQADAGASLIWMEKGMQKEQSKAVMSVIPYRKLQGVKQIIKGIDANAFVTISDIHEVNGKGYTMER